MLKEQCLISDLWLLVGIASGGLFALSQIAEDYDIEDEICTLHEKVEDAIEKLKKKYYGTEYPNPFEEQN